MSSHEEILRSISKSSEAAKRLVEGVPGSFTNAEIDAIEKALLIDAPRWVRLDKLLDLAHAKIAALDPNRVAAPSHRVAYPYPKYTNVLAGGFSGPTQLFDQASDWLDRRTIKRKQPAGLEDSPATRVAEFVVAAILDFEILDADQILPLLESIRAHRVVTMERMKGIPIAIARGREEHAMERLIVVRGRTARLLEKLRDDKSVEAYLDTLAVLGREKLPTMLSAIESGIVFAGPQTLSLKLKKLIDAACQVAITRMPTSILAHRNGLIVSHALKLSVLARIGRYSRIARFPKD